MHMQDSVMYPQRASFLTTSETSSQRARLGSAGARVYLLRHQPHSQATPPHSTPRSSTTNRTSNMASLCVSNLAQFFESLGLTTPYPPTPQPQSACDLTHIPYSSWRPPTCTQKCPGPCAHGAGMRVDERVTMPSPSQRARDADVVADAQAQCAVASAKTHFSGH